MELFVIVWVPFAGSAAEVRIRETLPEVLTLSLVKVLSLMSCVRTEPPAILMKSFSLFVPVA